jgi:hypothetical protein
MSDAIPRKSKNRIAQVTLSAYVSDDVCNSETGWVSCEHVKAVLERSNYQDFIRGQLPEKLRPHVAVDATEYFFDALTVCKELLDASKRAGPEGQAKLDFVIRLAKQVVANRPQHFPPIDLEGLTNAP